MAKRAKDKLPIGGQRKRAAIYARFSSHNQRGESIEIQLDNDYAYCDAHDLDVYDVYIDEAKTGRNSDREDFQRMLADAQRGLFDYVVIYKVPRIMRNRDEMAMARIMLRKCGVEILYAGEQIAEGSTGILQLGMLELLAEWESAVDSERILDGIEKNAERGMANGQPYYGWDITPDGYYSINEPEARILRTMKDMLLSGSMVAEIVRALAPYRTRKGKPFSHNGVTKLLRRRQNGGEYNYFGHVIPGGMPALWSMEEQEMILRILDKRSKPRKRSEEGEYALTGKLYHAGCDMPMVGTSGTSKSGATYYYYRCRKCKKTVRRDTVEGSVVEAVVAALSNPATREKIADLMTEFEQDKDAKPQSEVIKDELHGIELAYDRIWKAIEEGMAPPGGKERIEELTDRQKMLEDELRVARSIEAASLERDRVLFWLENMAQQLDEKTIIEVFVARVVLVDDELHIMFTFDDNADITNPLLDDGGGLFDQMSPCSTITSNGREAVSFFFLNRTPAGGPCPARRYGPGSRRRRTISWEGRAVRGKSRAAGWLQDSQRAGRGRRGAATSRRLPQRRSQACRAGGGPRPRQPAEPVRQRRRAACAARRAPRRRQSGRSRGRNLHRQVRPRWELHRVPSPPGRIGPRAGTGRRRAS